MPKPVKDEIFGSRKSVLKSKLDFQLFENIFFATCLRRINPDPASRYMLLRECFSKAEYACNTFGSILPFFRESIRIGNVLFSENQMHIRSMRKDVAENFQKSDDLALFLLNILNCSKGRLIPSNAKTIESSEVSSLSRFLRKNLYGRVGSTDIDFMMLNSSANRLTFIEEKLYTVQQGGSIGHGQYLSYRELIEDAFNEAQQQNIRFYLVFIPDEAAENCFVYNFMNERHMPQRSPAFYDARRKEQRILFPFSEMQETKMNEFLSNYVLR